MMILSTLRTETAASVAKRIAHALAAKESTMLCSGAFRVPSVSACGKTKQNNISYPQGDDGSSWSADLNIDAP